MLINAVTDKGQETLLYERIRTFLPDAEAELLLVGTRQNKSELGFRTGQYGSITTIPPKVLEYIQRPQGPRDSLKRLDIVYHQTRGRQFNAVAIFDFTEDIHPLVLFEDLDQIVVENGVIVLAGQRKNPTDFLYGNWLKSIVEIGEWCGYEAQNPEVVADCLQQPTFVIAFRKTAEPRWHLGHVEAKDYTEIAGLFAQVFGQPLSRELWDWKYGEGRGNAVIVRRDGELVSHYGSMYREILFCGRPVSVIQIGDVMVHPKERGVLTKQGPFLLAAATVAQIYGPLGFGFPNRRAMRVAEKMGLYTEAGKLAEVRWQPGTTKSRLRTKVRHLDAANQADRTIVNRLWAEMAQDFAESAIGVRDWKFIEQRYFRHPHHYYDVLLVTQRLTGKPLGIVVIRKLDGHGELLDFIGPLENLPAVIDQARRMTAVWSLQYLFCWITERHASLFVDCEGEQLPLDISIPASSWNPDPRCEALKDKWWLMSGDTDFH